ncbi:NACHT, LRR and PYD domains-containing protein 3-like isoform X2 [Corythoichthys intestinalis]|uniref:NACHT, LRR and PYD domains-containing protein 3-like isoform X2 n=1 Tax=Corythoichthys intestinalis TaxID=161448 RepID=UPI0025A4FF4E|nr:NACHT, LRR and PYD domains-containing protein 3-like isoform X2 [Corythoichthys intestinalis]
MLHHNKLQRRGAVYDVQIARLKADLQGNLQRIYSYVPEGNTERWQQQPLADVYTELDVTYGAEVSPDQQHEVLQMETRAAAAKESILPCDIFKSHDGKPRPIRTLLTTGFAGIGKTFLVQKFVCDWASGNTNKDVHFIFPFAFRELNTDEGKSFTLAEFVRRYVCESRHMSKETLDCIFSELQTSGKRDYESSGIKILFILDGLDECNLKLDLKNELKVDMDVTEAYPLEVLLAHLIKRNLLPCARVWITTRPTTAHDIPSDLIDSRTEVRGFSDSQRLEYFRKRFPNEERVTKHIQKSRTIFIMCHMPIFCWLTATVLQEHLDKGKERELPTTLTNLYSEYAFNLFEKFKERQTTEYFGDVKALAKLAFHHTMSMRQIFYEKDLADSGLDYSRAAKHCGIFTQVFQEVRPLRRNQQDKIFQFIHLTIQQYMAALYVMMCLFHDNNNVLADSELAPDFFFQEEEQESEGEGTESYGEEKAETEGGDWKIIEVFRSALLKASESEGNLDLFLRFLFGLSVPCNQELVGELLKAPQDCGQSRSKTVKLLKDRIKRNPPEKNINLFYCLNELKDDSLLKQLQKKRRSRCFDWQPMTNDMWSALAFFLLTDDETMESFCLREYDASPIWLEKLLVVVKASRKSNSPSNLRHLDLGYNHLSDKGVEILSKGLASPHCILKVLKLVYCGITKQGCVVLAEAFKLNPSHLQELDLSKNTLWGQGVEILLKGLASPHCNLQVLKLAECGITRRGCVSLAEALQFNPSHLQELHLRNNFLLDEGVEILSKGLASPYCILKVLKLDYCRIQKRGCLVLAEALKLNPSHLQELNLGFNDLSNMGIEMLLKGLASPHCIVQFLDLSACALDIGSCHLLASVLSSPSNLRHLDLSDNLGVSDEGVEILSKGLASPHCILKVLNLSSCGITRKGCISLAEALKLNPSHLQELDLSQNSLWGEGMEILSKGLVSPHCILKVLELSHCHLDKGSCRPLASILSSPSNLRHLDLSWNDLSDKGVEILSKGLASPHCILESLTLNTCGFTDRGCVSLAEAVKLNPSHLQKLHLWGNKTGQEGKRAFLDLREDPSFCLEIGGFEFSNYEQHLI